MGKYSSDEDQRQQQQQQQQQQTAPRIKLKLRLNPSSNDASIVTSTTTTTTDNNNNNNIESLTEDRKRKKHKKKKSHKKHKRQKKNQESDDEETFQLQQQQQQRTHQHGRRRRESEQVDIDDDDNDDNIKALSPIPSSPIQQPTHMPVGGKRPFALIQAEQNNHQQQNNQEEEEDREEDDYDDTVSEQQSKIIKQEEEESIPVSSSTTFDNYSYQQHHQQNEDHGRNTIHERTVHPTERSTHHDTTTINRSATNASSSKQTNTTRTKTPPSRQRTASISTTTTISEHKPKKRGRPAKVKAPPPKPEPRPPPESVKKDRDLKSVATKLLDTLERRDSYGLFLQPVDTTIITDYLTVIKHPMDFATMKEKLNSGEYSDMEDFRQDFLLICTNAKTYNAPDTIYYRNADRLEHYGLKAIDRAAKTVVYESSERADTPFSDHSTATTATTTTAGGAGGGGNRWGSISSSLTAQQQRRRASSISTTLTGGKRDSNVKMEEEVDILGLDNNSSIYPAQQQRKTSRQQQQFQYYQQQDLDGMVVDTASSSRAGTPVRAFGIPTMTKKKKKKMTEAGIVYASDGSLAGVGAVSDLQTLIPPEERFSEVPGITMVNTHALPSAFYTTRSSYEEWSSNKHPIHPSHFADYGAFTALGNEPPGAFYTAQDACYIYPLYGDDRGEAYMRSLWEFAEGTGDDELTKIIYEKSNYLTRGAWNVLQESLKDINDVKDVNAEFGSLHVSEFKKAYESVTQQQQQQQQQQQ